MKQFSLSLTHTHSLSFVLPLPLHIILLRHHMRGTIKSLHFHTFMYIFQVSFTFFPPHTLIYLPRDSCDVFM